jgi:hypothetical protein
VSIEVPALREAFDRMRDSPHHLALIAAFPVTKV